MFECFARPHVAPPLGDEAFLVCDDDAQKRGEYSLCEGASWEPGAGPAGIAALSLESGSLEILTSRSKAPCSALAFFISQS